MDKRFCTPSAVIVLLLKNVDGKRKILLQRRQNTGFADGMWDLSCSGHVERGESMKDTCVRECREELGVIIDKNDLSFLTFIHKKDGEIVYYNAYFCCNNFIHEPTICESNKCSEISWFDINELPNDLIEDRKVAVKSIFTDEKYIEFGW